MLPVLSVQDDSTLSVDPLSGEEMEETEEKLSDSGEARLNISLLSGLYALSRISMLSLLSVCNRGLLLLLSSFLTVNVFSV